MPNSNDRRCLIMEFVLLVLWCQQVSNTDKLRFASHSIKVHTLIRRGKTNLAHLLVYARSQWFFVFVGLARKVEFKGKTPRFHQRDGFQAHLQTPKPLNPFLLRNLFQLRLSRFCFLQCISRPKWQIQ